MQRADIRSPAMALMRKALLLVTLVYWAGIAVLTHLPRVPRVGPHVGDKTAHVVAYAVLGALLYVTLWAFRPFARPLVLATIVLGATFVYGALDEVTQPLVGRFAEWNDWVADATGAALAVAALSAVHHF